MESRESRGRRNCVLPRKRTKHLVVVKGEKHESRGPPSIIAFGWWKKVWRGEPENPKRGEYKTSGKDNRYLPVEKEVEHEMRGSSGGDHGRQFKNADMKRCEKKKEPVKKWERVTHVRIERKEKEKEKNWGMGKQPRLSKRRRKIHRDQFAREATRNARRKSNEDAIGDISQMAKTMSGNLS